MGNSELRTSSGGGSFARVPYRLGACAPRSSARLRFRPDAAAALHDFAYRVAAQRAIASAAAAVAWGGAASCSGRGYTGTCGGCTSCSAGYMRRWEGGPGRTSTGDLTAAPGYPWVRGRERMDECGGRRRVGDRRKYEYLPWRYTVTQHEEHVLLRGHTSWCGHFATASQRGLSVVSTRAYIRVRVLSLVHLQRRK